MLGCFNKDNDWKYQPFYPFLLCFLIPKKDSLPEIIITFILLLMTLQFCEQCIHLMSRIMLLLVYCTLARMLRLTLPSFFWTRVNTTYIVQTGENGSLGVEQGGAWASRMETYHLYVVACRSYSSASKYAELDLYWNSPWTAIWIWYMCFPFMF